MAKIFQKEFLEITRIIAGMERHSEENDTAFDEQMKRVTEIFLNFTKKYPGLCLEFERTIDDFIIHIFINDKSVKEVFDIASKIKGLSGLGLRSFNEAVLNESEKFNNLIGQIQNSAFLSYSLDIGQESVVLKFNEKAKKTELLYEIKSLANPITPQYQLIEKYAATPGDSSIDLLSQCYQLGFIDTEDEALFEWEDKFNPKMWE